MPRYETFKQQVQRNLVALISVVIAVTSLSYNTWRNEKTDLEYDRMVIERSAERTGWVTVFVIRDLASVLEDPVPGAAQSLFDAWSEHWDELAERDEDGDLVGAGRRAIEAEIDDLRDRTLDMLQGLE